MSYLPLPLVLSHITEAHLVLHIALRLVYTGTAAICTVLSDCRHYESTVVLKVYDIGGKTGRPAFGEKADGAEDDADSIFSDRQDDAASIRSTIEKRLMNQNL